MYSIDEFLSLLENGAWHSLERISKDSEVPKQKLLVLARMLSETKVIEFKDGESKVKLKKEWREMLRNTDRMERYEGMATGTIILPPKKTIDLHGVRITNLADSELELGIRVDGELKEIAIGILE